MKVDESFIEKLKEKYTGQKYGEESWEQEKVKVEKILKEVEKSINSRYTIDSPINIGGTAIVIKVIDSNLGISHALKCARPIAGKESILTKIISSEIARLTESSHQNIVSISYKGEVSVDNETWPFYVMEYIDGALDVWDYIELNRPNYKMLVKIIQQCVDGLTFLHSRDVIHGDIKLENLLISPDGRVKISDLGSARILKKEGEDTETQIAFTREFAHPELRELVSDAYITDSNRARGNIKRSQLKKAFDLYALGKNILRILKRYDIADQELMPFYYRQYLDLMGCRLLDGLNSDLELALMLPKNAYDEIKYLSITEVALDIKKLTGEYSIHEVVQELDHHYPSTIQVSSPTATSFTGRVAKLLSQPVFRRLASISQLGLLVQIYPTATHSRLEHVLGTFSNVVRYCDSLWNDQMNPLFKQIITEHDINLVLLAALCHDLGQYPLAHDMEEAEDKLFSHKEISQKILKEWSEGKRLKRIFSEDWRVGSEEVATLLSTNPADLNAPFKYRLLHTLLDGPIDADKVDYLIRDSNNLNVPYGKVIDFERLLKCLTVVFKREGNKVFVSLGIHEKGKTPAEAVAFARYAMFGSVYWHHTSRALKSMLHRAVWEALPGKDRRSKEYRDLQEAFYSEVLEERREPKKGFMFSKPVVAETPQLLMTDYKLLEWVYNRTSDQGRELLKMICERRIFKRILVVSERKNADLWDKLNELRKSYSWQMMLNLQNQAQKRMIGIIDTLDDQKRTTSVLSKERTDEIVGRAAKGQVLFLIDIPGERKASSVDLYFLAESRFPGALTAAEERILMEDSILWTNLAKNFLKSVGKIRVFCHPDIIETCSACLNRVDIEGVLAESFRYVTA